MPRSNLAQDNWPHFRHLLEQLLENLYTQTEIVRSMLEEGDHADYMDVVADVNTVCRPMVLEFGTTTSETVHTTLESLRVNANEKTTMAKRAKSLPSRDEFPNQRKPWTFDDDQLVKAGHKLGLDDHQLAEHLNRSHRAIEFRRYHLRKAGEL